MGEVEVEWTFRKQGGQDLEIGETAPVQEDFFQHIYNVNWSGIGFLFVDSDGVFTSKDAIDWSRIAKGFSANAVAYGKKVWVAATDSGMKLSKDKGKTWKSVGGPKCQELVFAGPKLEGDSKEEKGAFYALNFESDTGIGDVYSSLDGLKWSKIHSFADLNNEVGIEGYEPENLGTGQNSVVLTATEWTQVPTDETQAGTYTRATKFVGSDGSLGGPIVYGPGGSARFNDLSANIGGGATWDQSTGMEYISYLKTDTGSGGQISGIYVNGAVAASSHVAGSFGTDINGGTFMAAAGGQCWFFANEITFNGPSTDNAIAYYMISAQGARFRLAGPFILGTQGDEFIGNTCGYQPKKGGPAFCTVFSVKGTGGLWTNVKEGWINTLRSAGGAVGIGKIKRSAKSG